MRNWFLAVLVLCLTGMLLINCNRDTGSASVGNKDDARKIRAHIDKIFQAYINKDRETVKSTHSVNWRGFLSNSDKILRGIDDYMKEADGQGALDKQSSWRLVGYKMLDYDIIFQGGNGIVCYIAELFWVNDAAKGSYKLRSIDIYGKEGGDWNQIASNIGPVPKREEY